MARWHLVAGLIIFNNEAMNKPDPDLADAGKAAFTAFLAVCPKLGIDAPDLSEADTRVKFIDPIFRDALGWRETEIHREEPVAEGFADYSFGNEFRWFHVEAKRTAPRFGLRMPSKKRRVKLSSTHLLKNNDMKPLLQQAASYSFGLGTEFAVLTNGTQFILFQSITKGRRWTEGDALIWHDHQDILDNFAEFWELLARVNVERGILSERFTRIAAVTSALYSPLQYIHNPEAELVRNPFWSKISQAFAPILVDQPENEALQLEIIENCYVSSPLAGESSNDLARLLHDIMPTFLKDAGVRHIDPDARGPGSFPSRLVDDLKLAKPGTYVLTGGVGSGKTTFLRRFAFIDQHAFIRDFCVWLHVDFLEFGADVGEDLGRRIAEYTYKRILETLKTRYRDFVPKNGVQLRALFQDEVDQLKMTLLFGVDEQSHEYHAAINRRVDELTRDIQTYVNAILRGIKKAGRCVVFVLDNTDQLGEQFQKSVFLFSQQLSDNYSTLSIVSLREEKFFAAHRQGVFDAYGSRKFHIGSPELIYVIRRRLEYGMKRYLAQALEQKVSADEMAETENVVLALIKASTHRNGNIIRFLTCVSAGDMRLALGMFRDFMASGNTDIAKVRRITRRKKGYQMPFHEFAKSAILGIRRYFRGNVARILNVFAPSTVAGASHWTGCRILARLFASHRVPSPYGEGYISTATLLREYRESFGAANDFVATGERLLKAGLLESEPPRAKDIDSTEALKISATGAYYWSFLIRSFAYHDLVLVDTPMRDEALARALAQSSEYRKEDYDLKEFMIIRISRVRQFLDYLTTCERAEMAIAAKQGGPYTELLSDGIQKQLGDEIDRIKRKTGVR